MPHDHRWTCALIGGETLLLECGDALVRAGHTITAVVSRQPQIAVWAARNGFSVFASPTQLKEAGPVDLLLSIANLQILGQPVLALARRAAINFHDGPLPEKPGLNAPTWAILEGDTEYAVTWHRMTGTVDGGPILRRRDFRIGAEDTALTLNAKCLEHGLDAFYELLDDMAADRLDGVAQTGTRGRTTTGRDRPFGAGILRFTEPVETLCRLARALDFGGYANPMCVPKIVAPGVGALCVRQVVPAGESQARPGTIHSITDQRVTIAAWDGAVALSAFSTQDGEPLTAADAAARFGLVAGATIGTLAETELEELSDLHRSLAPAEPFWRERLESLAPLELPVEWTGEQAKAAVAVPAGLTSSDAMALTVGVLGRVAGQKTFDLAWNTEPFAASISDLVVTTVPLRIELDSSLAWPAWSERVGHAMSEAARQRGWLRDLHCRGAGMARTGIPPLRTGLTVGSARRHESLPLEIVVDEAAAQVQIHAAAGAIWTGRLARRLSQMLDAAAGDRSLRLRDLPLLLPEEREPAPELSSRSAPMETIDAQIRRRATASPDQVAVRAGSTTLTWRELDQRSNALAISLRDAGAGHQSRVGVAVERDCGLPVALLGVLKAGAAFVPLDPAYPSERLRFMCEDAGLAAIVVAGDSSVPLPPGRPQIRVDALNGESRVAESPATPQDVAYVIYTSGSTGTPKGVMVEHRQVTSFFAAMDDVLGTSPGRWMAVTSLSFDISVLELLWTLSRGFEVVIAPTLAPSRAPGSGAPLFSLFYFASAGDSADYRLLLEGARFADEHGFEAVWVPERHFHAFGGQFPNPAVAAAAVAATTSRVKIRAGSVVLPLHHPARVAEEWSMVDRLSGGRAGISVASGWMPRDFVLNPSSAADPKGVMARNIDLVRRLWRGETVDFPGADGRDTPVSVLPRAVQPELPLWITSAGNVQTFELAGRLGANVLTHLLGQSLGDVTERIAAYRRARREAGHPGRGHVTLMVHTFVGPDEARVRELVRGPLREYLRSSVSLIRPSAWAFPAFRRTSATATNEDPLADLRPEEMEAVLDHAFERYYSESGLFGTPAQCAAMAARLHSAGADEIGCLVDFGVDTQLTLDHLRWLDETRSLIRLESTSENPADALAEALVETQATHFQCTPSLAETLVDTAAGQAALSGLATMLVGGDVLTAELAGRLRKAVKGSLFNMYGPTECTVWSSSHQVTGDRGPVPIGRPLSNTLARVVDSDGGVVPPGTPGELWLGGHGVARGYLGRPELTDERFVMGTDGARWYRTGDLATRNDAGEFRFLGRIDGQVKIRGHRVEVGEIESVLRGLEGIADAVVVAREDSPGDRRLVGYVVARGPKTLSPTAIREAVRKHLPEHMVPAQVVVLPALPLTPNGKLDRRALPAPARGGEPAERVAGPSGDVEQRIAAIWSALLGLPGIGRHENFFDLGGHSLLAIQAHRRMTQELGRDVSITDLFRFPTVHGLATHLARGDDAQGARRGLERAQRRLAAMGRRTGTTDEGGQRS